MEGSIVFDDYEYDPTTKLRVGRALTDSEREIQASVPPDMARQEGLFEPTEGMTQLQRFATGNALRTYSYEPEEGAI